MFYICIKYIYSWNNVVAIVIRLRAERSGLRISGENKKLSDLQTVPTGCEAHPATYSVSSGGSFPEIRRPRYDAGHSHSSSTYLNNKWNRTSISLYVLTPQ
jgi:hypothetical protein